jgi:hypothetical protein
MKLAAFMALGLAAASAIFAAPDAAPVATPDPPPPAHSPLSEVPEIALHQLGVLIPIGTTQNEAVWTLQNQGFAVSIVHGFFGKENLPKYLYCDYRQIGVRRYRRWQVAVVIVNGRVSGYRVVVGT